MDDDGRPGRRERKKAATRQAIADAAREMFAEHGFDSVTIKQIADRADVSLATVYAHFPQKEALVFDVDDAIREGLVAAVRDRDAGVTILQALHAWLTDRVEEYGSFQDEERAAWESMIQQAPTLQAFERAMWLQNEVALSEVITAELGLDADDLRVRLFAHFLLDSWTMIDYGEDPTLVLNAAFALLGPGWSEVEGAA